MAAANVPSPLPSATETVLLPELAVAKSALPSPLKSPLITEYGFVPTTGPSPGNSCPLSRRRGSRRSAKRAGRARRRPAFSDMESPLPQTVGLRSCDVAEQKSNRTGDADQ